MLKKIGQNAYKIDLPKNYGVSEIFNVCDLSPYIEENEDLDSRMSLSQPGRLTQECLETNHVWRLTMKIIVNIWNG